MAARRSSTSSGRSTSRRDLNRARTFRETFIGSLFGTSSGSSAERIPTFLEERAAPSLAVPCPEVSISGHLSAWNSKKVHSTKGSPRSSSSEDRMSLLSSATLMPQAPAPPASGSPGAKKVAHPVQICLLGPVAFGVTARLFGEWRAVATANAAAREESVPNGDSGDSTSDGLTSDGSASSRTGVSLSSGSELVAEGGVRRTAPLAQSNRQFLGGLTSSLPRLMTVNNTSFEVTLECGNVPLGDVNRRILRRSHAFAYCFDPAHPPELAHFQNTLNRISSEQLRAGARRHSQTNDAVPIVMVCCLAFEGAVVTSAETVLRFRDAAETHGCEFLLVANYDKVAGAQASTASGPLNGKSSDKSPKNSEEEAPSADRRVGNVTAKSRKRSRRRLSQSGITAQLASGVQELRSIVDKALDSLLAAEHGQTLQLDQVQKEMKVAIVGDTFVGKTSFVARLLEENVALAARRGSENVPLFLGMIDPTYISTTAIQSKVLPVNLENKRMQVRLVDTPGADALNSDTGVSARAALGSIHGAVLMFDVTNRASFDAIPILAENVVRKSTHRNIPLVLVGNKASEDEALPNFPPSITTRVVSEKEARAMALQLSVPYVEISVALGAVLLAKLPSPMRHEIAAAGPDLSGFERTRKLRVESDLQNLTQATLFGTVVEPLLLHFLRNNTLSVADLEFREDRGCFQQHGAENISQKESSVDPTPRKNRGAVIRSTAALARHAHNSKWNPVSVLIKDGVLELAGGSQKVILDSSCSVWIGLGPTVRNDAALEALLRQPFLRQSSGTIISVLEHEQMRYEGENAAPAKTKSSRAKKSKRTASLPVAEFWDPAINRLAVDEENFGKLSEGQQLPGRSENADLARLRNIFPFSLLTHGGRHRITLAASTKAGREAMMDSIGLNIGMAESGDKIEQATVEQFLRQLAAEELELALSTASGAAPVVSGQFPILSTLGLATAPEQALPDRSKRKTSSRDMGKKPA